MKVIETNISEVMPYDNNPRFNDNAVDKVAKSIEQFGFQQPIVVDKNMVIIVGHTRYEAAKELGLETIPVVVADMLSAEQVNAYRLVDNKTAEYSSWDFEKLEQEIDNITNIDLSIFNFGNDCEELVELADEDISEFFEPINPDDQQAKKVKTCTCPKCGTTFEV